MTTLAETLNAASEKSRCDYQEEVLEWLKKFDGHLDFAVTLTMQPEKVNYVMQHGYVADKKQLATLMKKSMRHFCNRLNRVFYKSAGKRFGKTAVVIPIFEGVGKDKRLHYHLAISAPERYSLQEMQEIAQREWTKTFLGGHQVVVKDYRCAGWLSYISKEAITPTRENIDWDNVKVPTSILQAL